MIKQLLLAKEATQIIIHTPAFKHWLMLIPIKTIGTKLIGSSIKSYLTTKTKQLRYDLAIWKNNNNIASINIINNTNSLYIMLLILDTADILVQ